MQILETGGYNEIPYYRRRRRRYQSGGKLKREDRSAEVKILTKSQDISYAGCGLPYYVGGLIETREELIVNTPQKYTGLTGAEVVSGCEVVSVDVAGKSVKAVKNGVEFEESYDKLIIATGATPFVPDMEGKNLQGVFCMRTPDDATGLTAYIDDNSCRSAVVVGAGFIGLEVAENLFTKGLKVTVIDAAPQIMPNAFDAEMADYAAGKLKDKGMSILTNTKILSVSGTGSADGIVTDNGKIPADVVVIAIGIRPATAFLKDSGIETFKGAILTNDKMETNLPDVYAVGDCAMVHNMMTGKPMWSAMGSTANIVARVLAKSLSGAADRYSGALGTGVVKLLPELNAGRTGLTAAVAAAEGFDPVSVVCVTDDKAHYYPDSSFFATKLIADKKTGKLLGIQVIGQGSVDKMVDIAITGIAANFKIEDFNTLDYAYAPPFSTAIHPFVQACYILGNKINGEFVTFTPAEYAAGAAKGYRVIDVLPTPTIPGAQWVNLAAVNGAIEGLNKDDKLLLVCARGKRGYFLQNRLKYYGYINTRVLEGGLTFNKVKVEADGVKLSPEEIKRVKALGCLQDKRYSDRFNVRVITGNGKLTTAEQMAVAEAGKITVLLGKNGSGKTTLLKCIGGIRKINGGEIKLFGVPISEIKGSDLAKIVSFMPQYLPQLHISAAGLVALGRSPYHGFINKLTENDKKIIDYAVTVKDTSKHLEKEKRK